MKGTEIKFLLTILASVEASQQKENDMNEEGDFPSNDSFQ